MDSSCGFQTAKNCWSAPISKKTVCISMSLSHARLDPRRRANTLKPPEARRLHKAIVSVLARALECCLHPAPDFRDPEWWFQGLETILRVYGREGKPCRRCGEPIRRIAQGSRSTYCCGRCQK